MKKHFHTLTKISLICVYLIIIAGAVVRMTGSGMGCPDWPKCFGYYIPPTNESDILFKPNHEYKSGHVIQVDGIFYYAKEDFITNTTLDISNWSKNTKHSYNTFNVTHTWIEYINRLFTAFAGIPMLIMLIVSFGFWKSKKHLTLASIVVIFAMGFEAWLGKTIVDSNLLPYKITIHMIGSFIIIASLLYLVFKSRKDPISYPVSSTYKKVLYISLLLTLIQVAIGTQVRQFVDEQVIQLGYDKSLWMNNPTLVFYIHRTFSFLILGINIWLFLKNRKLNLNLKQQDFVMLVLGLEILTGIVMYYFDFPFSSQPLHLVLAAILFGLQFYLIIKTNTSKKEVIQEV